MAGYTAFSDTFAPSIKANIPSSRASRSDILDETFTAILPFFGTANGKTILTDDYLNGATRWLGVYSSAVLAAIAVSVTSQNRVSSTPQTCILIVVLMERLTAHRLKPRNQVRVAPGNGRASGP